MLNRFSAVGSTMSWPTRRLATWAASRNINSRADLETWLTANITTLAQARTVLIELAVALLAVANDGEGG